MDRLSLDPAVEQAQAEERERNTIIAELTKPLVDGKGKPLVDANGRTRYAFEIDRIKALWLEGLRCLRDERAEVRRLRNLSKEELRSTVHQQAESQRQALYDSRYPKLPATFVPRGQVVAIPLDAAMLKQIVKTRLPWASAPQTTSQCPSRSARASPYSSATTSYFEAT